MQLRQQLLDGLLYVSDGLASARWNFPDAIGSSKENPAGIGQPAQVSYSFLANPPTEYNWGRNFRSFDSDGRKAAKRAIDTIAAIANISFEADSRPAAGSIRFGQNAQASSQAGFAYSPSFSYSFGSDGIILNVTELDRGGDVWLNSGINYKPADYQPGGQGLGSLMHELGHAIGLKHPFEGKQPLSKALESNQYTVMSYTPHPKSKLVQFSQEQTAAGTLTKWSTSDLDPRSLMLGDIAAIQALYGANRKTNAGATIYRYSDTDVFFETIWDGGGIDTLDCSSMEQRCIMSLNPGSFSSIGLRDSAKSLRALHKVPSQIALNKLDPNLYNGSNNLAIAFDCDIENATGSRANDSIVGNALANTLRGGLGADQITGGGGGDRFCYDRVDDSPVGSSKRDLIRDFNSSQGDRIDLSAIDADPGKAGRQAFRYIAAAGFSGQPGEVRCSQGLLQANLNADRNAEFELALTGVNAFAGSSLIV